MEFIGTPEDYSGMPASQAKIIRENTLFCESNASKWVMNVVGLMPANPKFTPHHISLRLHDPQGRLSNLQSISIKLRYRITIEIIVAKKTLL